MFVKDIEKIYTDTIIDYINKGYRIYYNTMSGHQGELAKIDLTNDKEIIRILLESKNEYCAVGEYRHCDIDYISLLVGRNTDKIYNGNIDTIWNNHLEVISENRFYRIGERWTSKFFGTKEEAISAKLKHYNRIRNSIDEDRKEIVFSDNAKKVVLSFMKRQRKCSSITTKQIDRVCKIIRYDYNAGKNIARYYISAKGYVYNLK